MYVFDPTVSSAVEVKDEQAAPPELPPVQGPLSPEMLDKMQRYWQAANYLTVGQIYLQANPLLREPLRPEHIKPRLLGHWGTSPGLSFIYVHLNRLINEHDVDMIYLAGPGHGGPAIVANVYLEGTYSEIYPEITQDIAGMRRLFRQFSTPGGIPSHVSVTTPGSIHEGGELGYVLTHAFGAAFDNPDLIVVAVVGDGEAETGPLMGSWQGTSFLNPARDGAVLPILHLNGYKIAGPTVLGRASDADVRALLTGTATTCIWSRAKIRRGAPGIRRHARRLLRPHPRSPGGSAGQRRHRPPALAGHRAPHPQRLDRPRCGGRRAGDGTFRAHQVPLGDVRNGPNNWRSSKPGCGATNPDEIFDENGRLIAELAALAPRGRAPHGGQPARQRRQAAGNPAPARLPPVRPGGAKPATERAESTRQLGQLHARYLRPERQRGQFPPVLPRRANSNRLGGVFDVETRCFVGPNRY